MNNIVHIPPKKHQFQYKRINIIITYVPSKNQWQWSFDFTIQKHFKGVAPSFEKAKKEAKAWVDKIPNK